MAQLCEYFLEASVYAVAYSNAFHKSVDLQLILLFTMQLNYFEEVASLRLVSISTLAANFHANNQTLSAASITLGVEAVSGLLAYSYPFEESWNQISLL